jgi:hypothetical protein
MKSLKMTNKIRKDPSIKKEDPKSKKEYIINFKKEIMKKKRMKINK